MPLFRIRMDSNTGLRGRVDIKTSLDVEFLKNEMEIKEGEWM